MTLKREIATFFASYVEAFAQGDADAISKLWDEVALFPAPSGNFALERSSFRDHCATLLDFYREQGVIRPEGELLSAVELFPGVAQARMRYRMKGASGMLVAEWDHVYVLRHSESWRVSLAIADGEMAAWAARKARAVSE